MAVASAGLLLCACGAASTGAPPSPPVDPAPDGAPTVPLVPWDGRVTCDDVERDTLRMGWLHWGPHSGYEFQWRKDEGPWETFRVAPGVTGLPYTSLRLGPDIPIGTRLAFRIRAQNQGVWSDWSPAASIVRPRAHAALVPDRAETGGTVHVAYRGGWVSALSTAAPDLYLYAGDRLVAHLGPIPLSSLDWDTMPFPEGDHELNLRLADGAPDPTLHGGGVVRVNRRTSVSWTVQGRWVGTHETLWVQSAPQAIGLVIEPWMDDLPPPRAARLWAGDVLVAELGDYPWPTVTWDPGTVPDGDYPIRIEIPGYSADPPDRDGRTSWERLLVHVDRTPPLLSCLPSLLGSASGWTGGELILEANEPASLHEATARYGNGAHVPPLVNVRTIDPNRRWGVPVGAPLAPPFRLDVAATVVDLAGNVGTVECSMDAPQWLAPWGEGPLVADGLPIQASILSLEGRLDWTSAPALRGAMAWVPPPGSPGAGRLHAAVDAGGGFAAAPPIGPDDAVATSASVSAKWTGGTVTHSPWVAWTGTEHGGPAPVRVARWNGAGWTGEPAEGIGSSVGAPSSVVLDMQWMDDAEGAVAFEELGADGRTRIASFRRVGGGWSDVGAVAGPPGSRQGAPALAVDQWGSATTGHPGMLLAYTETGPDGIPQVRAAWGYPGTGWIAAPGVSNLDAGAAASEPTAVIDMESAIAWVEAGRVLVRQTDFFAQARGFADAAVLNRDPDRRARSPRAVGGPSGTRAPLTVYFVEEGPDGDEIWARRWDGNTWVLLPGPVNAGIGGPVLALVVSSLGDGWGSTVAWIDDRGRGFARAENR